jgi:ribosomal protein L19E
VVVLFPLAILVRWLIFNMVSLGLQERLAASVLKCGIRRVKLDPNEVIAISAANSRADLDSLSLRSVLSIV